MEKGKNTHSYITQIHAFVLTQLSPTRQLHHLVGQQVRGSKVKLMGKSVWCPAITWPTGYHAVFCVCVSVTGYHALSSLKPVITIIPARALTWEWNAMQPWALNVLLMYSSGIFSIFLETSTILSCYEKKKSIPLRGLKRAKRTIFCDRTKTLRIFPIIHIYFIFLLRRGACVRRTEPA